MLVVKLTINTAVDFAIKKLPSHLILDRPKLALRLIVDATSERPMVLSVIQLHSLRSKINSLECSHNYYWI